MNIVRALVASLSLSALFALSAREAAALTVPPAACASGRNLSGWNAGHSGGVNITDSAWRAVGQNPDRIDELQADITFAVTHAVPTTPAPSTYALCRFAGIQAGALDEVQVLQDLVIHACILDGRFVGGMNAQLYCLLSELFPPHPPTSPGGLPDPGAFIRPPTGTCGANYEVECDFEFDSTSASFPGCGPFVTTPLDIVAHHFRDEMCTY